MSFLPRLGSGASRLLPFESAHRAQVRLARLGAVRRRLSSAADQKLLDRFLAELGIRNPEEVENAHRDRYLSRWINRARGRFGALPRSRQAAWLQLAGDTVGTLRGGALLVGSHFGCGLLTPLALAQLEIEFTAIIYTPAGSRYESPFIRVLDLSREAPLEAAIAARSILRQGGVVFVAGDLVVEGTDDTVEVSVLGRPRRIARGFAELSISSAVAPTPIFSRVDPSGRISTWIEPALAAPAGQSRRIQTAELAQGYADRLSANFARFPGSATPGAMRSRFASAPRDGSGS